MPTRYDALSRMLPDDPSAAKRQQQEADRIVAALQPKPTLARALPRGAPQSGAGGGRSPTALDRLASQITVVIRRLIAIEGRFARFEARSTKIVETGPPGEAGRDGTPGIDGAAGQSGRDGAVGESGPAGPQGERGEIGPRGERGEGGIEGPQGERGETGPAGVAGDRGEPGPRGKRGEPGVPGERGANGDAGDPGPAGDDGQPGRDGRGIISAALDDRTLVISYSDGTIDRLGPIVLASLPPVVRRTITHERDPISRLVTKSTVIDEPETDGSQ